MTEATIFAAALEKASHEDRAAYLEEACAGNAKLRRRVEALLRAHAESDDILDPSKSGVATGEHIPISERPGTRIGPYRLMEQIGEGGFGLVFVAEQQEPVRRKVALKVIKPGMDSAQVIARFEAERQALALMDHPNIARVLEAGTAESGRPYFVMELVRGIPITDYCDQNHLTPRERLELFVPVCNAIQHAHQKGIIHRDIKPSNVLVTSHDGKPVPKVIDFGVAKAINQHLTERTIYTQFAQMIGTPLYMSPEQAEMSGLDIDTRSDIYSLGVLLYELLTGTTPLERQRLAKVAYDEIRRLIREEEPPRPSLRLSTSATLPSLAATRRMEPGKLFRMVRGELDWIVMKALEKDRTRRYETANGLARDVGRYLADESVEACPPSASYRLRKFARKHRGAIATAALILALLVAGVASSTWQAVQANRARRDALAARDAEMQQRQEAERQRQAALAERDAKEAARKAEVDARQRATVVADLLESVFTGLDPRIGSEDFRSEMVRQLDDFASKLDKEIVDDPLVQARLRATLGRTYAGLGQTSKAVSLLEASLEERRSRLGAGHPDTLMIMSTLGDVYRYSGQLDKARALLQEAYEKAKAQPNQDRRAKLMAMNALALVYVESTQYDLARPLLEESLAGMKAEFGSDHPVTLLAMVNLGDTYRYLGEPVRGVPLLEEALAKIKAQLGADSLVALQAANNLATALDALGQFDRARPLLEEILEKMKARLGPDHIQTIITMFNLGGVYLAMGYYDKADQLIRPAYRDLQGKIELTPRMAGMKQVAEKMPLLKPAADQYQKALAEKGAEHPDTLRARLAFADKLQELGGVVAAEYHRRAVQVLRKK